MTRRGRSVGRALAHDRVLSALRRAVLDGDVARVRALLAPAVVLLVDAVGSAYGDGLGAVEGSDDAARHLVRILAAGPGVRVAVQSVNGAGALVVRHDDVVTGVVSVAVRAGRVTHAWAVLSPDKLRAWNRAPGDGTPPHSAG